MDWSQNFGDYDLFTHQDSKFVTTRFAIRYSVNGSTYWDNNGGVDHRVNESHPNTVGGNVMLNKAVARQGSQAGGGFVFTTSWVEGEILVNNLSFSKSVGIRLTTNNWARFSDTDASFAGTKAVATGNSVVEVWKFKTPELNLDRSNPNFNFAIYYRDVDHGPIYWDNNFGLDYTLNKADLSTDE